MEQGLSAHDAASLLKQYGPNEISEKKKNPFVRFLRWLVSPITLMLLAAAALSALFGKTFDALFIICLIGLNYAVQRWQEHKVDHALEKLKSHLTVQASVLREGTWQSIDSRALVPGDFVRVFRGNIIPADAQIIHSDSLQVNQSMLTGESLPVAKGSHDEVYSGSFVVAGAAQLHITKTGSHTYFGRAITLVDERKTVSVLEKDILLISHFLMAVSIAAVVILSIYFWVNAFPWHELLLLDLSLLIAGIPIALPTVMTLILHVGAFELTKKQVVVRRLAALDDLANVTLLLTDKTGTLTQNEIRVANIIPWNDHDAFAVIRYALVTDDHDDGDPISAALLAEARRHNIALASLPSVRSYTPADSNRKRATAVIEEAGTLATVVSGAPQVVLGLCELAPPERDKATSLVDAAAKEGYRILAIAKGAGATEAHLTLIGLLTLTDPLVADAKTIIAFLEAHGITVKMQTGDNHAIAAHVASELSLTGTVADRSVVAALAAHPALLDATAAFCEILPADKLTIVESAERRYITAVTGDGVNDIPAVKAAHIGIAVHNAVDALKSAADVVLLSSGIGVIKDAFIEARKVFMRMYSYSIYRISESFRLIMTVLILGVMIHQYPLTPMQLILVAFLNDIPIISLAFNRVTYTVRPEGVPVRKRFKISLLFGIIGVLQSIILFVILRHFGYPLAVIQTAFFLKLIISGHMLVFVAHTQKRWWRFFPSRPVILATLATSILASLVASFGIFMTALSTTLLGFVWLWALGWMQISELAKGVFYAHDAKTHPELTPVAA